MKRRATAKLALVHTDLAQQWANTINRHAGEVVAAVLAIGRDFIAAKKELHHGGWLRMFADHAHAVGKPVRFSRSSAAILMKIAQHPILANVEHVQHLPSSWGTLYELTKLPGPVLTTALAEGRIHPDITRRQVGAMRGRKKKRSPSAGTAPDRRPVPRINRSRLLRELPAPLQEALTSTERLVLNIAHAAHRPTVAKYLRDLADSVRPFRLEEYDDKEA